MLGVKSIVMNIYSIWKLPRMIDVRCKVCNNEYIFNLEIDQNDRCLRSKFCNNEYFVYIGNFQE